MFASKQPLGALRSEEFDPTDELWELGAWMPYSLHLTSLTTEIRLV